MNQPQPSQQQSLQYTVQDLMKDFAERKKRGDISWDTSGPVPVLVSEVYDVTGRKMDTPIRMAFSSRQVETILLDFDDQITAAKRQRFAIDEQIENLTAQRDSTYAVLSAELEELKPK